MSEFVREDRYLVFKHRDLDALFAIAPESKDTLYRIIKEVKNIREAHNKLPLECVVIESDWDCYEKAWELVEEEARSKDPKIAVLLATLYPSGTVERYNIVKANSICEAVQDFARATAIAVKEGDNFTMLDKTIPVPFTWLEKLTQMDTTK